MQHAFTYAKGKATHCTMMRISGGVD